MIHETYLIRSFVLKERQERYISLISTKKGRVKLRSYIPHFHDLNPDYCKKIPFDQDHFELHNLLKSNGAPDTCYIIAEHSEYDQKELPLIEALQLLFNSGLSYFLSCLPGRIAYYEGEDPNQRVLLIK